MARKYGCIVRLEGVTTAPELGGRTAVDQESNLVLIPKDARMMGEQFQAGVLLVKFHHPKLPLVPEGDWYPEWTVYDEGKANV